MVMLQLLSCILLFVLQFVIAFVYASRCTCVVHRVWRCLLLEILSLLGTLQLSVVVLLEVKAFGCRGCNMFSIARESNAYV